MFTPVEANSAPASLVKTISLVAKARISSSGECGSSSSGGRDTVAGGEENLGRVLGIAKKSSLKFKNPGKENATM